jgi:hypothetical protein
MCHPRCRGEISARFSLDIDGAGKWALLATKNPQHSQTIRAVARGVAGDW